MFMTKSMSRVLQSSNEAINEENSAPILVAKLFSQEVNNTNQKTVNSESFSSEEVSHSSISEESEDHTNLNNKFENVTARMEKFYNHHCNTYPVLTYEPQQFDTFEKIWSITFDRTFDLIYVFKAVMKTNQNGTEVNLNLYLQSWNLDDRILMDKEHIEAPQWEFNCQDINEIFQIESTQESCAAYLENKYKEYTQLLQNGDYVYFFNGPKSFSCYDSKNKTFDQRPISFSFETDFRTMVPYLWQKQLKDSEKNNLEATKDNLALESIVVFSYNTVKNESIDENFEIMKQQEDQEMFKQ